MDWKVLSPFVLLQPQICGVVEGRVQEDRVWWSSWSKQRCQQGATKFTGQVPRKEPPTARTVTWPSVGEGLGLEELDSVSLKQNRGRERRRKETQIYMNNWFM